MINDQDPKNIELPGENNAEDSAMTTETTSDNTETSYAQTPEIQEEVNFSPIPEIEPEEAPLTEEPAGQEEEMPATEESVTEVTFPTDEPVNAPKAEEMAVAEIAEVADPVAEEAPVSEAVEEEAVTEEPPVSEAAVEEAPVEETPAPEVETPATEVLPEVTGVYSTALSDDEEVNTDGSHQDLLKRLEEVLSDEEQTEDYLTSVTTDELLWLVQHFLKQSNLEQSRRRVDVVRVSFEHLKESDPELDEEEINQVKQSLAAFNDRLRTYREHIDQERKANAQKKQALIQELQAVVDKKDATLINDVRDIQNAWKSAGAVPKDLADELNGEYRKLLDDFYEQRKLHIEMMEYDHKRNLEEKERIIEKIKELVPTPEDREKPEVWREKMEILNELRQEWSDAGHVPREDMERINEGFRKSVDEFFEVRQEFMQLLDKSKEDNAEKKREILVHMEDFQTFTADKPREWNQFTDQLKTYQEAWKNIGPAPKSNNSELWSRYREICNTFFAHKAEFFKHFDSERNSNLELKRALVEQAEALALNTDWEKTSRELQRLQGEWRKIGPVPDRFSNKLWTRFRKACDSFFEGRRVHLDSQKEEEQKNLKAKYDLIDQLKALSTEVIEDADEARERLSNIQEAFRAIGHVPFKELDKLRDAYRTAYNQASDQLHATRNTYRSNQGSKPQGQGRGDKQKSNFSDIPNPEKRSSAIQEQIKRIRRRINLAEESVGQYEGNMGMIAKGKSGDPLRETINAKIATEKKMIADMRKQIKDLQELESKNDAEAIAAAEIAAHADAAAEEAALNQPEADSDEVSHAEVEAALSEVQAALLEDDSPAEETQAEESEADKE